jgi:hypothetical protein
MASLLDYRKISAGRWRLLTLPDQWSGDLQEQVLALVRSSNQTRHPQTVEARLPVGGKTRILYLKIFHPTEGISAWKDLLRHSKAVRFWRQGIALGESGFNAPLTIAVGEQRRYRLVQRGFVLTEGIDGRTLPDFLSRRGACCADEKTLRQKWQGIRSLGNLVRRFHGSGFVHGDLVASNILVSQAARESIEFYFMDNDRTRRFPTWLPQSLWKRNLVQLNRLPLPGISLQDRIRFLRAYLDAGKFSLADRKLAQWLELKTRQRRQECDGVDPSGNFRKLMRWSPELTVTKNVSTKTG